MQTTVRQIALRIAAVGLLAAGCGPVSGTTEPATPPASAAGVSPADASSLPSPAGLTPTACGAVLTPAQTEGPYYKVGSPERASLVEDDSDGVPLLLTGSVLGADCTPQVGIRIEFWQADGSGAYDNAGYRMRGHQFTDASGGYALQTVIPGEYPGRTPHMHVMLFAPDGAELLTTQLYLTGVSDQIPDGLFDSRLLVHDEPADSLGRRHVSFDFVLGM